MSIPRLAIERPVTMFMLSGVIILLGTLSLLRLPVDLMPDVSFPSITVRVGYAGVGPLEMEELVTRPIEQAMSAVAGLERLESTSSGRLEPRHAELRVGHRPERSGRRRPQPSRSRARPAARGGGRAGRCSSSTRTPCRSWASASRDDFDRVTLREIAEHDLSPRLERVPGVASVSVEGGLRRQIHVELSKEKIRALDLPVDRVINLLRTENQNIPLGEIDEGDRTYLVRSQGQFENLDEIRDLVVMTRQGVPVYMQDIAEVKDSTEDFRIASRASTASPASGCASPSSRARTPSRSPTPSARRSRASTGRCRASS